MPIENYKRKLGVKNKMGKLLKQLKNHAKAITTKMGFMPASRGTLQTSPDGRTLDIEGQDDHCNNFASCHMTQQRCPYQSLPLQ